MNKDMYGMYEDYELRGETFYIAYVMMAKDDYRKVIVKRVNIGGKEWFRLCAVWVEPIKNVKGYENGSWRNPTPDYCHDGEQYFRRKDLGELKARPSSKEAREKIREFRTDGGLSNE